MDKSVAIRSYVVSSRTRHLRRDSMKVENFLINLTTVSFLKMAVRHKVDVKIMDRGFTITQIN